MIILGIYGALGWDGNIAFPGQGMPDVWVHGSSATLFIDGKLCGALSEERLTRIKYDGCYPENVINKLLLRNSIKVTDIDIVVMSGTPNRHTYYYKRMGYFEATLEKKFPNSNIILIDHHKCHAVSSFVTSGYDEANIFTFDGGGEMCEVPVDHNKYYHHSHNTSNFFIGNLEYRNVSKFYGTWAPIGCFGLFYSFMANQAYNFKIHGHDYSSWSDERDAMEGKVMGLSAYGDYTKVNFPEPFVLDFFKDFPVIRWNDDFESAWKQWNWAPATEILLQPGITAEDIASWTQFQFEKYLLLFLSHIPKRVKKKKICLGGGCSLNILANSKIIEEGIYEDVHVNTAPGDDGISFGAAALAAFKEEKDFMIPDNIGCIGFDYDNVDIYKVLEQNEIQEI